MHESVVRTSLNDRKVQPREQGDHIVVYKVKDVGGNKPLKPEAVLVKNIVEMHNNGRDEVVMLLIDGSIVYPTVAIGDLAAARMLLEAARDAPGVNRRLFFGRIDGSSTLSLLDADELRKAPKAPRESRPPQERTSTPDMG